MSRVIGTLKLSSNIEPQVGAPLDARSVVATVADLTAAGNFDYAYVGMMVAVQATGDVYILKAKPATTEANWGKVAAGGDMDDYYTKAEIDAGWYDKEQIDQLIVKLYRPAGSAAAVTDLPDLSDKEKAAAAVGNVYNMTAEFETTIDFVEGEGKTYPAGTNVVVVDLGTYTAAVPVSDPHDEGLYELKNGVYVLTADTEPVTGKTYYSYTADIKFDVLPGFIDLSPYQFKFQVEELPEASEDEEGNIYQYVGATVPTTGPKNGFFYICQEVTPATDPATYEWVEKPVQDMAGGGSLSEAITASIEAGGIDVGDTYAAGTSMETLWNDLLNPLANPVLTAPSATLTTSAATLLETGAETTATLTATFSQGSIVPANGTDGKRSGVADTYTLNDGATSGTPQASGTFENVTINGDHASFTATVAYEEGPQPKNSRGGDYDAPLPAGTVTSSALTFEFVNALYANTASISTIAKLALVSASAKVKEFNFPAATIANPEVFDVPASWTVSGVEVYNTLSGTWETCASEFSVTDTTHPDAASVDTAYKRYTCNLGYDMGARRIRVKWA